MKIYAVITLILIISATNVFAQSDKNFYKFSKDLEEELEIDTTSWKYQMSAAYYSISGYYKKALEIWDKNGIRKPKISEEDSLYFISSEKKEAKEYIINRSKNEQIIIINEAHYNSSHRTFTKSLLQDLYNNGYKYLGLEALFDTTINERAFPLIESGFYTKEPEFGNMITEALKIGFIIFGYEASDGKSGKDREIEQALNIKKFIDNHPEGKVLIHCGFAHVNENEYKPWGKAMAGRLKEYSGIDPFTINQETFSERGNAEYNHQFIDLLTEDYPVVLIDKEGNIFNGIFEPKQTDIVVIHPKTEYINNRPHWLISGKIIHKIPEKKLKNFPVLALAYRKGEFENNGVPADIIEIKDLNQNTALYLPIGTYEIVLKNENYEVIEIYEINVK